MHIDGNRLGFRNWGYENAGTGWTGANSVLWNCHAAVIDCPKPPGAQNWAFGSWAEFNGDGYWESSNSAIRPASLYYAQLSERIGDEAASQRALLRTWTPGTAKSDQDALAERDAAATQPAVTMADWIDHVREQHPLDIPDVSEAVVVEDVPAPVEQEVGQERLSVRNGIMLLGEKAGVGRRAEVPWWRGSTRPGSQLEMPAITRFVPGRVGSGWTDDLKEVAQEMVDTRTLVVEQHPPLWYDRRRDDHERVRRMNGEVVAPFYEWPYRRSGRGSAWDGLSRFDLEQANPWYWNRLRTFSRHAMSSGRVLLCGHYFQHNILEAGAHYADYPWRTANNVNNPGFPEPPIYIGDKYIRMADAFYDVSDARLAALHRCTIEMALDQLQDCPNVVHFIGEEFTGPTAFVEFWVDTIAAWEARTGSDVLVALAAPKEAQDAILADETRAKVIDVIDVRYWWYAKDADSLFSLKGGVSSSPRMQIGFRRPAPPRFAGVANAVSQYRRRYPDKAVMFSASRSESDSLGWATLVAGGSLANIRGDVPPRLLEAVTQMHPLELPSGQWGVGDGKQFLVAAADGPIELSLPDEARSYVRTDIEAGSGKLAESTATYRGTTLIEIPRPETIVWLHPE